MTRPMLPYREGTKLKNIMINVVMDQGGLGDMITRIPAIKYMLRTNPQMFMTLWCPDYFIDLANLLLQECTLLEIKHIDDYKANCDWDKPHFSFRHAQHTSMATNLTRYAFNMLVNKEVAEAELEYPSAARNPKSPLESTYVVITTNYIAPARRFMQDEACKLINYFTSHGTEVILLGKQDFKVRSGKQDTSIKSDTLEIPPHPLVADKRDQTTLLEALDIMSKAQCVLGVDNGLIHLAACTDVPIVMGFTSVDPEHRRIIRHGELSWRLYHVQPSTSLQCRYCESRMGLIYGHRFKFCFYDDYTCCSQMTSDKFVAQYKQAMGDLFDANTTK